MRTWITVLIGTWPLAGLAAGAEPAIPFLFGTWSVKGAGWVLIRGETTGPVTYWEKQATVLEAEAVVTEQQGRIIFGPFTSQKAKEHFSPMIGADRRLHFADHDGLLDGRLVNERTVAVVCRHVGLRDTVVSLGAWTRQPSPRSPGICWSAMSLLARSLLSPDPSGRRVVGLRPPALRSGTAW